MTGVLGRILGHGQVYVILISHIYLKWTQHYFSLVYTDPANERCTISGKLLIFTSCCDHYNCNRKVCFILVGHFEILYYIILLKCLEYRTLYIYIATYSLFFSHNIHFDQNKTMRDLIVIFTGNQPVSPSTIQVGVDIFTPRI